MRYTYPPTISQATRKIAGAAESLQARQPGQESLSARHITALFTINMGPIRTPGFHA